MGLLNKIAQLKEYKGGVKHCTFNPYGPGVVRIHLIPPKFKLFGSSSYIVILNGYYLLPLGYSWAIILSKFMEEVNLFHGKDISDKDYSLIVEKTISKVQRIYPMEKASQIKDDLLEMLDVIFAVAKGESTDADIERLSIRSYSKSMIAPHRMDLMVSGMCNQEGEWKCNQKCIFCYASGQELSYGKELSCEEWKRAIDKLKSSGVPMLTFTGGEPTQRKDLCELIEYSKWFVTRLNTNGVLLTKELVANLSNASLDSVQITLYSSEEDIHNHLVGSNHFKDTVQGIKNAIEGGLDVSINTPLCKKNQDYLKTLEFIHSLGVKFVTISGLICTGTASKNHTEYDLTKDELSKIVKDTKALCNEYGMEIEFTSPGLLDRELLESLNMNVPACGACLSNMAISPNGTVIPCQSWLDKNSGLGNILTDDFKKIWKSPLSLSLRKMGDEEAKNCPFRQKGVNGNE